MSEQFKRLFTPLQIGPVTIRNRIVFGPHSTRFAEDHLPSERHVYYYAERAKGGVGLIITESSSVHPSSERRRHEIRAYDPRSVEGYSKIAKAVHEHGAKIFGQLVHAGAHTTGAVTYLPLWAPSPIINVASGELPKEMSVEEIEEVVCAFGEAAGYMKEGGFDGIEIHGASSYLVEQFMSPISSKRRDKYGGELENRLRFAYEVIDCVREAAGEGLAVGMRITGDELVDGGLTLDEMQEIAVRLEATGKLDYLNVQAGSSHCSFLFIPPMAVPLGFSNYLASGIRKVVKEIPVLAGGRIKDPVQAERILEEGHADMIAMVRPLVCDPEFPHKACEGREEEIRKCIACNQGCLARTAMQETLTCIQNPAAGREKEMGTIKPAVVKKRILVIGGGTAGLEAARVAALRGHEVILFEREEELGGQVRLAAKLPTREEFGDVIRNLRGEIERLKVEVRLGVEATPELIEEEGPDVVIVATGSRPLRSGFTSESEGVDQGNILTVWDVLDEGVEVGRRVVVIDGDGGWRGVGTAEFLVDKGKDVEILTGFSLVGMNLSNTSDQVMLYPRLYSKGVKLSPQTGVKEINGDKVIAYHIYSGEKRTIEGVDTVVLAIGEEACNELFSSLRGRVPELYAVGDCVAPRGVEMAIYEGHRVGRLV